MEINHSFEAPTDKVDLAARIAARITVDGAVLIATRATPGPYVASGLVTIRTLSSVARRNPRTDFSPGTIFNDAIDASTEAF